MKQREKKIALAAVAVVLVLFLVVSVISGTGRKNPGAPDPNSQNEISEAGGTAAQENMEAGAVGENKEGSASATDQTAEAGAVGDDSGGAVSGNGSSSGGDGGSGDGNSGLPAGSHKTTNANGTQGTVLPAEPLKPTKVERPGNKPARSQGSQGESQLGTHEGNQSEIQGDSNPGIQEGNPSGSSGGNPSSQTGATTPIGSGGDGSENPAQEGSNSSEGVELPIILFD